MGEVIDAEVLPPKLHPLDPRWGEVRGLVRKAMPGTLRELVRAVRAVEDYDEDTIRVALDWLLARKLAREEKREDDTIVFQRLLTATEVAERVSSLAELTGAAASVVGRSDIAEVAQKGAAAVRAIPGAIEGIKREAQPAIGAVRDLYQTVKAKDLVRRRPPYKPAIQNKRPITGGKVGK